MGAWADTKYAGAGVLVALVLLCAGSVDAVQPEARWSDVGAWVTAASAVRFATLAAIQQVVLNGGLYGYSQAGGCTGTRRREAVFAIDSEQDMLEKYKADQAAAHGPRLGRGRGGRGRGGRGRGGRGMGGRA